MNVVKLNLERVFERTERLEAPLFQRPYVWKEQENWLPLWESIEKVAERRLEGKPVHPHFLGTIVLDQLMVRTGQLHARQIIDGQQRLTTLQLALAAVRDLCTKQGESRFSKSFSKLLVNEVPLSDDPDDQFKVWPTNADRQDFKQVMIAGSANAVRKLEHAHPDDEWLIPNAYLYFSETFDDWLGTAGTETFAKKLEALYYSLKDDVHLVVIDLEREDDAQEIFETLNALGTPLLPADLVKNYLFHLANRQKLDTRKLYDTYWKAFDDDRAYWRKEVRQGRLKRPQLDLFLNHFLTLMLGEEVLIAQVFSRYREYVEDRDPRSSSDHMVIFRGYADVYRKFDEFEADSREGLFFYRLEQLDTTTFFPILLEALKRFDSESGRNELHQILGDLESFFVRRTICDLTTKGYNKLTVEMIKEFKKESGGISGAAVRQFLLRQNSDTGRWPNDEELRKSWNSSPIYKAVKRSKVRMILEALEAGLHSGKTERIKIDRKLTIEHLLPRDWEAHWPLPPGTNQELMEDAREAAIHVVGNLSLLTRELNPSVSNGPWQRKRAEILKHSALNLNRTLPELWSEEAIHARSRELFEIAVKVWPFPPQSDHSLKPVGTETASSLK